MIKCDINLSEEEIEAFFRAADLDEDSRIVNITLFLAP